MRLHFAAATAPQQAAMRVIAGIDPPPAIYLAGGVAVALHCGHRRSVDLDWFAEDALGDPILLADRLRASGETWVTGHMQRGTLHGSIEGVKISFLEYGYRLLQPLVADITLPCAVASVEDLAAMKLLAIAQRGAKKDFIDVYALAERIDLAEMLDCYRKKFAVEDVSRVLYALCYFADADAAPMPQMLVKTDWEQVKRTIQGWVKQIA
jgi:hypothetical protein